MNSLRFKSLAALCVGTLATGLLAACSPADDAGSDAGAGGVDVVSLVDADGKTPIEDIENELGAPTAGSDIRLCYITRTLSNEYWSFERDGFEQAAQEYGVEYETYAVTDEASITEQLDKAQSAMKSGCSAILASPISATALDSVFEDAIGKGIPVIILNDAASSVKGTVYVGPDATTIGATAAAYIAEKLPNGGKVAMIEGDPGSSNAQNRGTGFRETLEADYPNIELVASTTAKWDTALAKDTAAGMLTANDDLAAIYCQNDTMALGAMSAIQEKGKQGEVILVGTDGIPQAKTEIANDNGYTATVSERPTTEGSSGVKVALWMLAGEKVPAFVDVPAFIVDEANVNDYLTGMP
ncbi:ribose transport system substrate-binding protein [Actinomyces ruminicola]|uniref:Ribose transport system substrate-binding protein n=1 Tax=Actinomyces ruminicola TaxID=332524 RepID=A0A1H0C058_9ACTO|nr:substrate-binding domain-containing protein [Actinomyces ruminicola]SDN51257.1 ribose transport system substrate-binding protein [Actinomyces ruminicola]